MTTLSQLADWIECGLQAPGVIERPDEWLTLDDTGETVVCALGAGVVGKIKNGPTAVQRFREQARPIDRLVEPGDYIDAFASLLCIPRELACRLYLLHFSGMEAEHIVARLRQGSI